MSPRVSHLLFDFDCTITTRDTLHLIASAGYTHQLRHHSHSQAHPTSPPGASSSAPKDSQQVEEGPVLSAPGFPSWTEFGAAYQADLDAHSAQFGSRTTLERELEYLASLKSVEQASVRRVERSGLFRGVTEPEIRAQAKYAHVRDPDGLRRVFKAALERGSKVGVISVTWSSVLVRAVLGTVLGDEVVGKVDVRANDVVLDSEGRGTGGLSKEEGEGIATGADKLRVMREVTGRTGGVAEPDGEGKGMVVYVGDSTTDLPPLLEADVGVVVDDNAGLKETCERVGVKVLQGLDGLLAGSVNGGAGGERTLYNIEDWSELLALVDGR